MNGALSIARNLWRAEGLPADFLKHLKFHGNPDTAINSSFKIGAMAQASIGVTGLASAYLHYLRTGVEQDISVDARHATLEFHSHSYYTVDGQAPPDIWDPIAGVYLTKDQSFVRIHTNFPHHRKGVLDILQLPDTPETTKQDVSTALAQWNAKNAEEFEQEAINRGTCVSAYRSFDTWDQHPHAATLVDKPPMTITKIGDAPKRVLDKGDNPLRGVRVLDLSRVLAGPVAGRTLAAHGADDLLISSPNLPALPGLDADTSRGKRTTHLDLTNQTDRSTLENLVSEADVFLQAYRPGGLASKGFGAQELVKLRPGIISANLCAWGWEGPWKDRRGFDSLVQTATGFNHAEAEAYHEYSHPGEPFPHPLPPRPFPYQALDYAGGYLLAFGIITALCRSITEGGSWEVRVSLAGVARWLRSLGRIAPGIAFGSGKHLPSKMAPEIHPEVQAFTSSSWKVNPVSGKKEMVALRHPAVFSVTPCVEGEVPIVLNAHEAKWV
ncbi:Succinate--hydroxymethylglutarate CoA-transferase [Leucoagaricus sp. SymC.cos]|nr:Succinate--hydroxymethylglutarate CoA-transferase [Leucoagaricus sp. SymC.cos]